MKALRALAALLLIASAAHADQQDLATDVHGNDPNPWVVDWFARQNAPQPAPSPEAFTPGAVVDIARTRPRGFSGIAVRAIQLKGRSPEAVSIYLSGGSRSDREDRNENSKLGIDTRGVLLTRRLGWHFVVARSPRHDIAFVGPAGGVAGWQLGRIHVESMSQVFEIDPLPLVEKTPGQARFAFAAEDSEALRDSFGPEASLEKPGKVWVTGDWNNWSMQTEEEDPVNGARALKDDGQPASGDQRAGDGLYTRIVQLPAGTHAYAFMVSADGDKPRRFTRDPYEEGVTVWPAGSKQRVSTIVVP